MKKIVFQVIRLLTLDYYFQRKKKNRLLVLLFHEVNDKDQLFYGNVPVKTFDRLCRWVKKNYPVIRLSEIESHFKKTDKPAAIISFDDGHYDIKENALPVLKELGLPFNINIDTEILETGKPQDFVRAYEILNNSTIESYYNSKFMEKPIHINRSDPYKTEVEFGKLLEGMSAATKRTITEDLAVKAGTNDRVFSRMLSVDDLRELANENTEIGSHTHTHSILTTLSPEKIEYELTHSKTILENIVHRKVDIIAYPNGISDGRVENVAVRTGYTVMLDVDNEINTVDRNNAVKSYKRVNMYHRSFAECLAHIYGVQKMLKKSSANLMTGYTYRFLTAANIDELNKLFEAAFQTVSDEGLFSWKYFSNPAGNAIVAGAFDNDVLVGSGAMVPEIMNVFGIQETVYKCTDLMTHPLHQKKGISQKINELLNKETAKQNPSFYYTLCSRISTKSFLKNNWSYVGAVVNFVKPRLYLKASSGLRFGYFRSVKLHDSIDDRLDDFSFRIDPAVIAVKKTAAFLKWRMSNPNFNYKILCSYDNQNRVNGYLIYSIGSGNRINIIDFEATADDRAVLNNLYRCIEHITAKGPYKALLAMAIKNTLLYRTLKQRRFLYNPFSKGPLISALDFDVYYADKRLAGKPMTIWDFSGLNYDDV